MAKRNSRMSENLKTEIAKELGVYESVRDKGWGDVSSRDCGRVVQKAIEFAERSIANQEK
ncbi:MAG TPA: small, acid-soluble spore protein, alpha/beta type [Clostridiales bacterium]|nr:small, acid-soluble spore protein, alpha/beta type [Clostridia bacterium]MDD4680210.1 small, acid-soluble spore protein, alpha/beta type [Clostridia bacterium]HCS73469.1 small, acid-soluble spore protein, alpha/beta type [Clostridiales bacterium]